MLRVEGLSAWHGAAQALFDIDLQVQAGELVVLQGLNGAGKSTLLQSLMNLGPRCQGRVSWQGQDISAWAPEQRARAGLGYVAEDRRIFVGLTVRENLEIAARDGALGTVAQMFEQVLALFPALGQMLGRPAHQMSGGEQQMLAVARTLMTQPTLMLLDEPCEGIAPLLVAAIRDALLRLSAGGMGLLVAEQGPVLTAHAHQVLTLRSGHLSGRP
ncbi:MAG: High-affinity branched-chain amino acid transport ATP-binding protein LivF [Pseudomonadota bacterium]|jgi:branched-chain amino acid transport system ATP-binding protein